MASVEASPPRSSSAASNPIRRKPLPSLSPERSDWSHDGKPLPTVPIPQSSRVGQAPVSPVRVNFQPENWAQPSSATIETRESYVEPHRASNSLDRELPKTPDAPAPPPHSPRYEQTRQSSMTRQAATATIKLLPPLDTAPAESTQNNLLSPASASPSHGLDISFSQGSLGQDSLSLDPDNVSLPRAQDENRHSRDTDTTNTTASTSQQQASNESSATTSASSVSGTNEAGDSQKISEEDSLESSIIEEGLPHNHSVPQLQYHHQSFLPRTRSLVQDQDPRIASTPDLIDHGAAINRHLTPTSYYVGRRTSLPRPQSSYSVFSDFGPRGRSPGLYGNSQARAPSAHSRKSPDTRPSSYAELLNVPYPQPAPAPISFDNSQLRNAVGSNASLLSSQKTLEMYRQNVKKTNDFSIQYSFAVFLISTAQEQGLNFDDVKRKPSPKPLRDHESPYVEGSTASPHDLVREARAILQKLANAGYPFAQYYLADGYASGLFSKGKEDYNSAFPLFVLAAKHGHAESAYRTGLCYEFGWGCRKDPAKAVQFLRTAASKRHPGAMTRLGKACLSGDLGEKRYREGIKWLKLATESADTIYNAAPYHLGCLYETGYGDDIFKDESYAAELFTQAADLGHPEANYRMGDAYEHGKLNCPRDPALSVHFYTGAAERGHAAAMMGLCAWYMVGAEPILEKDEEEAYEWARRSAELGYVKAEYAVGYFTEMGIGCRRDILEANVWYVKAADAGDERAKQRLAAIRAAISGGTPMEVAPPRNGKIKKNGAEKDENCVIM